MIEIKKLYEQPEYVQKAIKKLISRLKSLRITQQSMKLIMNAKTGEEFYHYLERNVAPELMEIMQRKSSLYVDKKYRADMVASLLLNQKGIPGLRFLDNFSRMMTQENTIHTTSSSGIPI